jgi:AbrB family looped-hinge helix DNA binding protein
MNAVKLSPKYQVVIPRDVRESLNLIPGQMMQVIAYSNRAELMPSKDIREMRGFLKGIDTTVSGEEDRLGSIQCQVSTYDIVTGGDLTLLVPH